MPFLLPKEAPHQVIIIYTTRKDFMKRRNLISLILHLVILAMTVIGCIMRFGGVRFFSPNVSPGDATAFRYFTIQSNVLFGIISVICIVFDALRLVKKIEKRPKWVDILEYLGVACLTLTMVTVILILAPGSAILQRDIVAFFKLFYNHNLFFHLLTPVAAIIAFLMNANGSLSQRYTIVGLIPALCYEVFYSIVSLSHMDETGKVPSEFDWYGFMRGGIRSGILSIVGMAALAAVLSFLLLFFYKKVSLRFSKERSNKEN